MFCCPKICHCIFKAVRIVLMVWLFLSNFVGAIYLFYRSYYIVRENWWQTKDEALFLTNASWSNAALCWIIWIPMYFVLCILLCCYLPCCLGLCCVSAVTGKFGRFCEKLDAVSYETIFSYRIFLYHWIEGNIGLAIFQYNRFNIYIEKFENNMRLYGYDNRHYNGPDYY